jgi:hypothetical protein
LRELSDQAHGANLDLGHALIHNLTGVDPANIDVARFFVLRGRRHSANYADRLTMRISRCRTRGNGDEAGRGAGKERSARAGGGEEDGSRRASMDRFHVGAGLPTPADLGREGPCVGGRDRARSAVRMLAIADEAAASGRRPGASAVRHERQSGRRGSRRSIVHRERRPVRGGSES